MSANAVVIPHRWSRAEYERMVEAGVFEPSARFELIAGAIIDMTPQSSYHATTIQVITEVVRALFGAGFHVRTQMPLALGDDSEPEPDIAVVKGAFLDYLKAHPTYAELVVEVANTTVAYDQLKANLYAQYAIPVYWLVNLKEHRLEVYQQPENGRYRLYRSLKVGEQFEFGTDKVVVVSQILV